MKFEKRNFMGIDLDVLVGHPEHDVLFVATQVARAAGLSNPSQASSRGAIAFGVKDSLPFGSLTKQQTGERPKGVQAKSWLFTEGAVYRMLMQGNAPQSEPFRKWVAEEVLPSIRKTGKYSAEESSNPIAQAIVDQLKTLEGIILKQGEVLEAMRQELSAKTFSRSTGAAST